MSWLLEGNQIFYKTSEGARIATPSSVVVGAQFKSKFCFDGVELYEKPSRSLGIKFSKFPLKCSLEISVSESGSECFISLVLQEGKKKFILEELPSFSDQLVIDGRWFPVDMDSYSKVSELLEKNKISDLRTFGLGDYLGMANSELVSLNRSDEYRQGKPVETKKVTGNSAFVGKLYDYQERGVSWLSTLYNHRLGGILGDEMGLGKTCQIIASIVSAKETDDDFFLIIAPSTLLENWRREFEKFAPSLNVRVQAGNERTGFPSHLKQSDIIVTSYDIAVRDLGLLKMIEWKAVILDEAQNIKNHNTQRAIAVKSIPRKCGIAVTGTPIENSLTDLWSIMDFCVPTFLGELSEFESLYEDNIDSARKLEIIITPFILRRLVKDVAEELPEKIVNDEALELNHWCSRKYEEVREMALAEYGTNGGLVSLLKLRMFCTDPSLILELSGDPCSYSVKYIRLVQILEEILDQREKVIIFTSYQKMADLLQADLNKRFGVPVNYIDGRVLVEERQPKIDSFQSLEGSGILILNPRAAGAGLNITAANHVIHFNLEWNPAIEDQATARAYRRGQDLPVRVHRFFYIDTVEDVINSRIQRKRSIAEGAIIGVDPEEVELEDFSRAILATPKK